MDTINGIPLIWDAEGDTKLLGGLTGNTLVGAGMPSLTHQGSSEGFIGTSQAIWQGMRQGSPLGDNEPTCGAFVNDFYGTKQGEVIDYKKVVKFIKGFKGDHTALFDWKKLTPDPVRESVINYDEYGFPFDTGREEDRYYMVPYVYADENGKAKTAKIAGKLNKRICYLEHDLNKQWAYSITIDADEQAIEAKLYLYYKDTYAERSAAIDTIDPDDFRIDDKYKAIVLVMEDLNDFAYLVRDLYDEKEFRYVKATITKRYFAAIKKASTPGNLNFLYKKMPDFVVEAFGQQGLITEKMFFEHLLVLEVRDELSPTEDSSRAVINLMRAVGDIKLLYRFGYDHPELIKQFFYNLDGSSTFDNTELTHKTVFASIFMTVCKYNGFSGFENVEMPTFRIGDGFYLDNHIGPERDKFPDKYSLTQQHVVQQRELITAGHDGQWYENIPSIVNIGETGYYHPFHPVYYVDETSKDKTPVLVPALFVKAIAHQQKVAEIMTLVRVLADVLALVIGVVSLGSGSALYVMLGAIDIGIAAKDLHVISQQDELMKTEEGREYLENWNRIALIGSIPSVLVLAGPLLGRTFNLGAKLFSKATATATKNFLRAGLLRILLEINIANFTKNTVKVLDAVEVSAINELRVSLAEANKLYDAGVVLVKGDVQVGNKITEEIAVTYNAEVIAKGTPKSVKPSLNKLLELPGQTLGEGLEKIINRRKVVTVENVTELGQASKTGAPVKFKLIDEFGNSVGEIIRTNEKADKIVYKLVIGGEKGGVSATVELLDEVKAKFYKLPVNSEEKLLYADFNIPAKISEKFSGIGGIMLDDALAYFKQSKKFGKVDGIYGVWLKNDDLYGEFGGRSVNLKQFWDARIAGETIEAAALSTFTGKWAKGNGFGKVVVENVKRDITEVQVILRFIKEK